jgi:2-methylcitrate dehydratase PrpD
MTTVSAQLASWTSALDYPAIPADLATLTKLRILDVVGVVAAGAAASSVGAAITTMAGGAPAAASPYPPFAPGGPTAFPLFDAFANGALAAALDYEDTHNSTVIHPSSPATCAALALAAHRPATGRALITAVAAGIEGSCRIAVAAPGEFHRRGFHAGGVLGVFASTLAAARLLRLDGVKTGHAIGIAASFGAGIMQSWLDGSETRFCHTGFATSSGLLAAQLAAAGITGPAESLEGKFGIFRTHLQGEAHFEPAAICAALGEQWESRNVSFKPYPTGQVSHSFIDAALHLRRMESFAIEDIEAIVCPVADYMVNLVCEPVAEKRAPRTANAARVSLPQTMAEALIFGEVGPDSFSAARLADPRVRDLAVRVAYRIDADAPPHGRYKGWVQIRLRDGRLLERIETTNLGSPEKPLDEAALRAKFRANVRHALTEPEADAVADAILSLERQENVARTLQLLSTLNHPRGETGR